MGSVLGIVASPRQGGNCETLTRAALAGAAGVGARVDLVRLADLDIHFCRGCLACVYGLGCPLGDDAMWLYRTAASYDGLILSAPVYLGGVPAALRTFIDRGVSCFPHFEGLRSRPAATILVSGRSPGHGRDWPERFAQATLTEAAFLLGGRPVGAARAHASGVGEVSGDLAAMSAARSVGEAVALDRPLCPQARPEDDLGFCPVCGLPLDGRVECLFCSWRPGDTSGGRYHPAALAEHHEDWMLPTRDRFLAHLDAIRQAVTALGPPTWRRIRPPRA